MVKQVINVGTVANDHTGDGLHDGLVKANSNFDQLFSVRRPYRSGRLYIPGSDQVGGSGAVIGANSIRLFPAPIIDAVTIADLLARVSTTDAAGHFQLALYAASATTDYPTGTPLVATGNISTAVGGLQGAVAAGTWPGNLAITQPDLRWLALVTDSATAIFNATTASSLQMAHLIGIQGAANVMASAMGLLIANPGAYGTWPDFTATSWTSSNEATTAGSVPLIAFKPA
jgi:hypothetical protein